MPNPNRETEKGFGPLQEKQKDEGVRLPAWYISVGLNDGFGQTGVVEEASGVQQALQPASDTTWPPRHKSTLCTPTRRGGMVLRSHHDVQLGLQCNEARRAGVGASYMATIRTCSRPCSPTRRGGGVRVVRTRGGGPT